MPHVPRPDHKDDTPVHVTFRKHDAVVSLRRMETSAALRDAIARASSETFRVVHFSIQVDHVHLIVEADSRVELLSGIHGLAIRTARAVNQARGRRGRVWGDRYHSRALASPTEVRNGIRYVLQNWKKHHPWAPGIDPCSSGPWFEGWHGVAARADASPTVAARTWLGTEG